MILKKLETFFLEKILSNFFLFLDSSSGVAFSKILAILVEYSANNSYLSLQQQQQQQRW